MSDELETTDFGDRYHWWTNAATGEVRRGAPIDRTAFDALPRGLFGRFNPDVTPLWPVRIWRFVRRVTSG